MTIKNTLLFLGIILAFNLQAQHSISGNMAPAEDLKWLIAYKINATDQSYIADAAITNGAFKLEIPENSPTGMYRIVYAIPQDQFYFDLIYNGKEDIVLSFDLETGLEFQASQENIIYYNYFNQTNELEYLIDQLYASNRPNQDMIEEHFKQLRGIQLSYEQQAKGLMTERFVKANQPYIPKEYQHREKYLIHKKKHYFDAIDFKDPVLQGSSFLVNKVTNYVFNTFSTQSLSMDKVALELQQNIDRVAAMLDTVDPEFATQIMDKLWDIAVKNQLNPTAQYIYSTYLQPLAKATNNTGLIQKIATHNRLQIGAVAPEVAWNGEGTSYKLSELSGNEYYVLVFWSSECSHCTTQLPKLQQEMKAFSTAKVLAIGLENDQENWKMEASRLPDFIHGISLGKWESPYVKTYDIYQTPTYLILDAEKRILAKPGNYEEVVQFLKEQY